MGRDHVVRAGFQLPLPFVINVIAHLQSPFSPPIVARMLGSVGISRLDDLTFGGNAFVLGDLIPLSNAHSFTWRSQCRKPLIDGFLLK